MHSKMLEKQETYTTQRANDILEVVMSYARLDFSNKSTISDNDDVFDAIASGVNMLGEELEASTISLKEKEHLLKEIHHRVKNNLQIISSLLNLQSDNSSDEKFLAMIRESKNRIMSMALIHEMLYVTKDLSHINIHAYITKLCNSVYQSYQTKDSLVEFVYNIDEDLYFEIDNMIPIGLILNEILSNSFKYAFPNKKGIIEVHFQKNGDNYRMIAKDNGIGIPKSFNAKETKTLGSQLIYMLTDQLDGKLKLESSKGTKYTLEF